jgi:uncharacterized repeat protein (TIGR01451 family)/LPXTG-motif cell wall-anchored protein
MKAPRARGLLFVAGLLLIVWGMLPWQSLAVSAAPPMAVTETPTTEPPSPTTPPPSPTPGNVNPTSTPTNTPVPPTNTPVPPTNTPTATTPPPPPPPPVTETPTEPPPRDTARPTSTPPDATATSATGSTTTPGPGGTPPAGPPPFTPTPVLTGTVAPTPGGPPTPDPAVTKSVNPPTAVVGDSVVYTIQVTNLGGLAATGVVVEDTLPAFLSLEGATATRGTVSTSGNTVRVEIGDLAPGETVEVRVTARVRATAAAPNNRNLAVVSSTSPDANPDNNQASVPLDTTRPASLPNTGDDGMPTAQAIATALGLALVAGSLLLRRRARR